MTTENFEKSVDETIERVKQVLVNKGTEYAPGEDRLHNFRGVAAFNNESMERALWGMLSKHLKSLSDMVKSPDGYMTGAWNEKTIDAINYLFLLRAIRDDGRRDEPCCAEPGHANIVVKERR